MEFDLNIGMDKEWSRSCMDAIRKVEAITSGHDDVYYAGQLGMDEDAVFMIRNMLDGNPEDVIRFAQHAGFTIFMHFYCTVNKIEVQMEMRSVKDWMKAERFIGEHGDNSGKSFLCLYYDMKRNFKGMWRMKISVVPHEN